MKGGQGSMSGIALKSVHLLVYFNTSAFCPKKGYSVRLLMHILHFTFFFFLPLSHPF